MKNLDASALATPNLDQWAHWLLHRRHRDDPAEHQRTLDRLTKVRDRVLDNAAIAAGDTLLDVGTGDGLIGFGALDRVGEGGHIILSDISQDLIDHNNVLAERMGVLSRCQFLTASAEDLSELADGSVDVVTTRSVLAYVPGKARAFQEFARVLRPDGRISLYEPVNRHFYPEQLPTFFGYDVTPVHHLAAKITVAYERRQSPETDPMFDFDERTLLALAEEVGFDERHLELRIDIQPHGPEEWDAILHHAPNPLLPTLDEAMAETLTDEERSLFTGHLRPAVERGNGSFAVAVAYLWGTKR